jgi:hypothetical protein
MAVREAFGVVIWSSAVFMILRNVAFAAVLGGDPALAAENADLSDQREELSLVSDLKNTEITANMSPAQITAINEAKASYTSDHDAYFQKSAAFEHSVLNRTAFAFDNPVGWAISTIIGGGAYAVKRANE